MGKFNAKISLSLLFIDVYDNQRPGAPMASRVNYNFISSELA